MARPIAPTPKLDRKATEKFMRKVGRDLKRPVGLVATPKLDNVIKMIKADAQQLQK